MVDDVCGMLQAEAQAYSIKLDFKKLEPNYKVAMDKMRTQQILINLVQNAIKYNEPNGWVEILIRASTSS